MAEGTTTKVFQISVDSAQAVQAIADYSAKIQQLSDREKKLREEIKKSGEASDVQAKELVRIGEQRKAYNTALRESSKEVQNNIKQQQSAEGSLKSLRAQLSNLTKQYDELSKAEREGAFGKDLQKQINDITNELKGAEEGTQRFYRNVGNYAGSLQGIFGQLQSNAQSAIPGMKALGLTAQASFGWIGVVVGALVGLIGFFKKAITSSEGLSMRASEMFAFLKTGAVQLQNLLQSIGNSLLNVAQFVIDTVEKAKQLWAEFTGNEEAYNKQLSERKEIAKALTEITKEENAITLKQRKLSESNADAELKIAKLKANAAEKNKFTAKERLEMLKKANDEEEKMSRENFELAKRKYEVLQKEAELSQNSAEANEKLSQSYVEMRQAEIAYFNKRKELAAQMVEAENQIEADRKKRREAWKAKLKENRELREENIDKEIELMEEGLEKEYAIEKRRYELVLKEIEARNLTKGEQGTAIKNKAIELAQQEHYKNMVALYINHANEIKAAEEDFQAFLLQSENDTIKQIEQITKEYRDNEILSRQNDIAAAKLKGQDTLAMEVELKKYELDTLHQLEEESNEEFRARQLAAEKAYIEAMGAVFDAQVARWDAAGGAIGQLSKVVEAFGEDSKEAAIAAKAIAIGEIAVQTGVAIAKGVASSAGVPFPANLAAILTTVATVLGNIASATSIVKSAKFATGGYVSGPGTATSDSIPAQLSNGESVLNAQATSMFAPILSPLNQMGGGVPIVATQSANQVQGEDMLARAFAKGMSEANIRVGVDEISRVQNRVKVIENIGVL